MDGQVFIRNNEFYGKFFSRLNILKSFVVFNDIMFENLGDR